MRHILDLFRRRRAAYRAVFLGTDGEVGPEAKRVLADLRRFAGVGASPYKEDPRDTARMIGRQEMFLRVQNFLNLNDHQVYQLEEQFKEVNEYE